uniref:HAT C-terminal dimerisation domain-containing protein n=1 Tax=Solanum lycopersicum TaxID=4081 RepID=A0A3Q7HQR6_SOLLC
MLSLDMPSRWNSTYLMLDTTEKFEKAFERFDFYDGNFNSFLATDVCEDGNICELDAYLKLCIANDDLDLSKMALGIKEKFKKYWGTPEKMNKMIFIASVLHPRNKFVYVSFALEELLGEETGNVVNTKVEAYLRDLFANICNGISQNVSKNSLRTKLHMKKQKNDSGSLSVKCELDKYLFEDQEPESGDFDILSWWKVNSPRFPVLSQLARDVLAIPMSSVASKCAFSTGSRILDPFRSSLTPK